MKIDRLETHDRLLHFKQSQEGNLFEGVEMCLKGNRDCLSMQEYFPYVYIFAHPRTEDGGAIKRMIWQPRITKPKAQTNSYLFRAISKSDLIEIIWMLPPRELWKQYEKGKITASEEVMISIRNFVNNRKALEAPHKEDFSEEKVKSILMGIHKNEKKE